MGEGPAGFAMIDEAMAAALGGERSSLDTVVYTCCDMLNACEVATDLERAAQWCEVADAFIEQYGCPFLYAECRTLYGGVLVASGRWADADRELAAALHITADTCPALHGKALTRLAGLRIRQGRLEEAHELLLELDERVDADAEAALTRAALLLARGDAAGVSRVLAARAEDLSRSRDDRRDRIRAPCRCSSGGRRARRRRRGSGTPQHIRQHDRRRPCKRFGRRGTGPRGVRRRRCRRGCGEPRIGSPDLVVARPPLRDRTMHVRARPGPGTTPARCGRARTAGTDVVRTPRRGHRQRPRRGVLTLAGITARVGPKRVGHSRSASRKCCDCSGSASRTRSSPNGCT